VASVCRLKHDGFSRATASIYETKAAWLQDITRRICEWKDICRLQQLTMTSYDHMLHGRLRRVTDTQVAEKVAVAAHTDGVVSLWSLDMGEVLHLVVHHLSSLILALSPLYFSLVTT
jgi:hypothetical protein